MSAASETFIADKLRPMVTEERLLENALDYEVMQLALSSREERQVEAIKERLLGVPLVHATRDVAAWDSIRARGIESSYVRGDEGASTFGMDESLDLDRYAFMSWGRRRDYGGLNVLVDGSALLGRNTLVTPHDIAFGLAEGEMDYSYSTLDDSGKGRLDRTYFSKMVTGSDWLEITARRVHQFAQDKPEFPYPIEPNTDMGEVKCYERVDPRLVTGKIIAPFHESQSDETKLANRGWSEQMLQHGMALDSNPYTLGLQADMRSDDPEAAERFRQAGWLHIMNEVE